MSEELISKTDTKPWYWMRGDKGVASVSATLVFVAFVVTTIVFLLSSIESIGGINFRQFDVAACSTYFVPILSLYFGRKWTDAKRGSKKILNQEE